jgi:hypothetical protein
VCFLGDLYWILTRPQGSCRSMLASPWLSVHPCITNREQNEFWNLIFESFVKLCRYSSVLVKIGQQCCSLCMKTHMCFCAHFELNSLFIYRSEKFSYRTVEENETHLLFPSHLSAIRTVFELIKQKELLCCAISKLWSGVLLEVLAHRPCQFYAVCKTAS